SEALRTPQWYMLTAILALNTACGIAFISQASDAAQDVAGVTAATAAGLVGVLGLFNGAGRVFWAWLSDRIGRMRAFLGMLALQAICFAILPHAAAFAIFAILAAFIYLAYGGGFGTMPATAADHFGPPNAGAVFGGVVVGGGKGRGGRTAAARGAVRGQRQDLRHPVYDHRDRRRGGARTPATDPDAGPAGGQ